MFKIIVTYTHDLCQIDRAVTCTKLGYTFILDNKQKQKHKITNEYKKVNWQSKTNVLS